MSKTHRIPLIRRFAMPLLKLTGLDIRMTHPWVAGQKIKLHSFKHKGYWWHGKNRELKTMSLFSQLIKPAGGVVEVGGHIGFITIYFSHLVGPHGRVVVFEPGMNNLPYIRANIRCTNLPGEITNIDLVECAVGSTSGTASLYEDSLTGQNNSMVKDFPGLKANMSLSYVSTDVQERIVPLTTIDHFFARQADHAEARLPREAADYWGAHQVDFLKIDVEGFEYEVLSGAGAVISVDKPVIMVEVQADHERIFQFLKTNGYRMFNDNGAEHQSSDSLKGNVFCLHSIIHKDYFHLFGG